MSGHRNETPVVRAFEVFTRNTIFFRSHDQTDRATQVGFKQRILTFLCAGDDLQSGVLHELNAFLQLAFSAYRDAHEGASGSLDRISACRSHAAHGNHQRVGAHAFCASGDRTKIAHIRDAVEQYDQWLFSTFVDRRKYLFDPLVLHMGQKGHDPLVILPGQSIEFLFRDGLEEQIVLFDHLHEFPEGVTAFSLLEIDLVEVLPRLNGFHQWPNTKQ